eukprot:TRINITY_DN3995_c3_g1_i1.p1 TRINITY_DN3995_c3_g1~~TRINITY_DN3995_c3_g1_i1.p1  ORF type:complete len:364 (+),score=29.90 TRINITY_DN3995_c3_g1_i1:162-1253(+)
MDMNTMSVTQLAWWASRALFSKVAEVGDKVEKKKMALENKVMLVDELARRICTRAWDAMVLYIKICLVLIICAWVLWCVILVATGAGGIFSLACYYFFVPEDSSASIPFTLDYNQSSPQCVLNTAGDSYSLMQYAFDHYSTYNFTVTLDIPETPHNLNIGAFTVTIAMMGIHDEISRLSHSGFLQPPRSELSRHIADVMLLPYHVATGQTMAPTQVVKMPMKGGFRQRANETVESVVVYMSKEIHVYSAVLHIQAELDGVSGVLQRWPILSCAAIFLVVFLTVFNTLLLFSGVVGVFCLRWWYASVSGPLSEERRLPFSPPHAKRRPEPSFSKHFFHDIDSQDTDHDSGADVDETISPPGTPA